MFTFLPLVVVMTVAAVMVGVVDAKEYIFLTRHSPAAARTATFGGISKRTGEPISISSSTKFSFELHDVDDSDGPPVQEDGWYENLPIELASDGFTPDIYEWNIHFMNLSPPPSQQHEPGGGEVPVFIYVVDTGIRNDHSLFSNGAANRTRVLPGYPINKTDDCNGHGTHVSSIAGGSAPIGIAGRAQIIPVAVFQCNGQGMLSDLIGGVSWIIQDMSKHKRARVVVNLSLQTQATAILDILMEELWDAGALTIVAAGNSRSGARDACQVSPARSKHVVSVGAIAQTQDEVVRSSNIGKCVQLYAPGESILGASPYTITSTQRRSGTSMASAHVSGLAAYVWTKYPNLTRADLYYAIRTRLARPVLLHISDNNQTLNANVTTYRPMENGDGHPTTPLVTRSPSPSPTIDVDDDQVEYEVDDDEVDDDEVDDDEVDDDEVDDDEVDDGEVDDGEVDDGGDEVGVGGDDEVGQSVRNITTGVRGGRMVWHLVTMMSDSNCTVHSNNPTDTPTFTLATRRYLNKKQTRYQTVIHATLHTRRKQYILRSSSAKARHWPRFTGRRTVIEMYRPSSSEAASGRERAIQCSPIPSGSGTGGVRIRVPFKQFYIAISASISSKDKENSKSSPLNTLSWSMVCST